MTACIQVKTPGEDEKVAAELPSDGFSQTVRGAFASAGWSLIWWVEMLGSRAGLKWFQVPTNAMIRLFTHHLDRLHQSGGWIIGYL